MYQVLITVVLRLLASVFYFRNRTRNSQQRVQVLGAESESEEAQEAKSEVLVNFLCEFGSCQDRRYGLRCKYACWVHCQTLEYLLL